MGYSCEMAHRLKLLGRLWTVSLWAAALQLGASQTACAGDLESWNQLAFVLYDRPRLRWSGFGAMRMRSRWRELYEERAGTLIRTPLGRRGNLTVGYLARLTEPQHASRRLEQWVYAYPAVALRRDRLVARVGVQYERHMLMSGIQDFNRYRPRFDLQVSRPRLSPFLMEELTFLRQGLARNRNRAGFRYRWPASGSSLEVCYQIDSVRRGAAWRPLHAVVLSISVGLTVSEHQ